MKEHNSIKVVLMTDLHPRWYRFDICYGFCCVSLLQYSTLARYFYPHIRSTVSLDLTESLHLQSPLHAKMIKCSQEGGQSSWPLWPVILTLCTNATDLNVGQCGVSRWSNFILCLHNACYMDMGQNDRECTKG